MYLVLVYYIENNFHNVSLLPLGATLIVDSDVPKILFLSNIFVKQIGSRPVDPSKPLTEYKFL